MWATCQYQCQIKNVTGVARGHDAPSSSSINILQYPLTLLDSSASLSVIIVLKIGYPIGLATRDSRKSSEGCLVAVVAAADDAADASAVAVVDAAGTSVGAVADEARAAADAFVAVADASAAVAAAPADDGGSPHFPV